MKRFCLALDLKDDDELIRQYEEHHKAVWPEITRAIGDAGITEMEIYRIGTRLFMIMETDDNFNFEHKATMDYGNVKVQECEQLILKFQQPLSCAKKGEKWILMDQIFQL